MTGGSAWAHEEGCQAEDLAREIARGRKKSLLDPILSSVFLFLPSQLVLQMMLEIL